MCPGRCEGRAAQLLGVQAIRAEPRIVLALRQGAGKRLGLRLIACKARSEESVAEVAMRHVGS